jgi:hypothetical protein
MKRLAAVVMMIAIATVIAATLGSAQDSGWGAIHGTYAMTGVGTCINSPLGFQANFTPKFIPGTSTYGLNFSGSNLYTGTWTFDGYGRGQVEGYLFGTATSPYPTPNASMFSIKFDFTYTLTHDSTIDAKLTDGTFLATGISGPLAGATYRVEGITPSGDPQALLFSGKASTDHKTLTLNSEDIQIQKITVSTGMTNYQICNVGRVLIRVDE